MSEPVYRDPMFDGATDPVVVRREGTGDWWMLYTQRRTTDPGPGVRWIHGTRIGIAVSTDDGATWTYRGEAQGLGHGDDTLWAPEVVWTGDRYRMYLTVVEGVHETWTGSAFIEELHSDDLEHWTWVRRLDLSSDRIIDAALARCGDGLWRLWWKDERDDSTTWSARSADLGEWEVEGRAVGLPSHEGPNVFELGGVFWMITDEWHGLGVHRSTEGVTWERQAADGGLILHRPGASPLDREVAHHADAVVLPARDGLPERAVLYYFTHAGDAGSRFAGVVPADRPTPIHAAVLTVQDGVLVADRDVAPGPLLR